MRQNEILTTRIDNGIHPRSVFTIPHSLLIQRSAYLPAKAPSHREALLALLVAYTREVDSRPLCGYVCYQECRACRTCRVDLRNMWKQEWRLKVGIITLGNRYGCPGPFRWLGVLLLYQWLDTPIRVDKARIIMVTS